MSRSILSWSLIPALFLSISICRAQNPTTAGAGAEPLAPRLDGLGNLHHPITTKSPDVQRFFDQGLVLAYGFNHAEAARSFREAARLDPDCAMCYWGIALVQGPNINAVMDAETLSEVNAAVKTALQLAPKTTPIEQAYIQALATRYPENAVDDRKPYDQAYANAMRRVSQAYPDDPDAATLFAESLMDTSPWDYWTKDGQPKGNTQEILTVLESVIRRHPDHPGANHFYIHAVEAAKPELGVQAADRLGSLVPNAGHLVHMPSHIYIRIGRYEDAVRVNEEAIRADNRYITQCRQQNFYSLAYGSHNHHFLWAAASFEGRSQEAMKAARATASKVTEESMHGPSCGSMQQFSLVPLFTEARFGWWDQILKEPKPADDLPYPLAVWHYARGLAFTGKQQFDAAEQELEEVKTISKDPKLQSVKIFDVNSSAALVEIASRVLEGELAAQKRDFRTALSLLEEAERREEDLLYSEPPDWYYPVRHSLGAVFLAAGNPAQAERVYREDLKRYPENGWSLFGLAQALSAQGKSAEARGGSRTVREVLAARRRHPLFVPFPGCPCRGARLSWTRELK